MKELIIEEGTRNIEWRAFTNCTSLAKITINENNMAYDSRNNCNAIIEKATNTLIIGCKNTIIPNSVTSLESYVFIGWTSSQTINVQFKESEIPSGWSSSWNYNCNAVIKYLE